MVEFKNHIDEDDCSLCFEFNSTPIRKKSCNCKHSICLYCFDSLLYSNSVKCPYCKKIFSENDLEIDSEILENLFKNKSEIFISKFLSSAFEKLKSQNMIELDIAYGNEHEYKENDSYNKHLWKAFVRLEKNNHLWRSNFFDRILEKIIFEIKLKLIGEYDKQLDEILNLMKTKILLDDKGYEIIDKLDVIKQVTFNLHPTFNPRSETIKKSPFEISRIGWGTFTIEVEVTLNKFNGSQEKLLFDIDLSFSSPITKKIKKIYLPLSILNNNSSKNK